MKKLYFIKTIIDGMDYDCFLDLDISNMTSIERSDYIRGEILNTYLEHTQELRKEEKFLVSSSCSFIKIAVFITSERFSTEVSSLTTTTIFWTKSWLLIDYL